MSVAVGDESVETVKVPAAPPWKTVDGFEVNSSGAYRRSTAARIALARLLEVRKHRFAKPSGPFNVSALIRL